ncbi:MAG TPA: cupin domain-containing protein [Xanthobacteraceae bacterium]|jgi:quercetin dioxygenase-like cupin family protein|nr:cupin domain-containing protein [Xanthobacteraceae bacterium]
MSLTVRRVVTGHDNTGKAVVKIDEVITSVPEGRKNAFPKVIWTTEGFPVNNDGDADESQRSTGTTHTNGTVFRVISFGPGVAPRNHRTDSIDYAVVLSGEIDMEMDDTVVHLSAGDVLVQRGTIHNWVNNGTAPCVIAFVLIAANSVKAGGNILNAVG